MKSIPEFFDGKNIFLTGGSGFIGKALIEKLLRSCPNIGKIYILVRNKRGKTAQQRIDDILDNPLFDLVKQQQPEAVYKIVPILGDINKEKLGISEEDEELITSNVHIIYHGAASVRFNDPLLEAINTNVRSTRDMCYLALKCRHIKAFIHISTTYCYIEREIVKEEYHPACLDWRVALKLAEENSPDVEFLTHKLLHPFPNSYSFTKRIAENVVVDLCRDRIPLVILRPSIVIFALQEPIPGWIGNLNGPFALVTAFLKGITDVGCFRPDCYIDTLFVDNLSKALIIVAWKKCKSDNPLELDVYNASTDMKWIMKNFETVSKTALWKYPHVDRIWVYKKMTLTPSLSRFYMMFVSRQVIFAIVMDLILRLIGKNPRLLTIMRKVYSGNVSVNYFAMRKFYFENHNYLALKDSLNDADKDTFKCQRISEVDDEVIRKILKLSITGVKRFIFKEPYPIKEETYRNTKWLYSIHIGQRIVFFAILLYLLFWKFNMVEYLHRKTTDYFNSL